MNMSAIINGKDIILTRRSIRKYKPGVKITQEQLDYMLKAAFTAPNAGNRQPWEFLIADTDEAKAKILKVHKWCDFLKEASVAIIILGNEDINADFWVTDCALASENIMIAANALNLGTCLCCGHPIPDIMAGIAEEFALPASLKLFGIVVIGAADEEKEPALDRFDPKKIHYNAYTKQK
jgi:nitroreductase